MNFLFVLGRDTIRLFDADRDNEQLFIDGEAVLPYEIKRAKADIHNIIQELAAEYNLEPVKQDNDQEHYPDISFTMLWCADASINEIVQALLKPYIRASYDLPATIKAAIAGLSKEDGLVATYGINYDGINYKLEGQGLKTGYYNLLAYTLKEQDLLTYLQQA